MQWALPFIKADIYAMTIFVSPYDQPDAHIFNGTGDDMMVWRPDKKYIILGQSNSPEMSLIAENVIADKIAVTKRPTGGEAVVLTPQMAVLTVAREFNEMKNSKDFFGEVNTMIIDALTDLGVRGLGTKGISDITIGNRKILGSSMHRRERRLVYHAVLNIGEDPGLFERYLRHPRREPKYRRNRSHSEFVTSLKNEGYKVKYEDLAAILNSCPQEV
jgi:lipoate-protein ligase A